MRRGITCVSIGFLFLAVIGGCGYSTRSVMTHGLKTIYVAPFKNQIVYGTERERNVYLPLMEVKVSKAIIDRFLFDGNLKIVPEGTADAVLKGELINYERLPVRYDDNNEVLEYRINITVAIRLWDTNKEENLWEESRFSGDATYFVSGSLSISEDAAVEKAVLDLARRVVERTVEDW